MVRTLPDVAGDTGPIPGLGTRIARASGRLTHGPQPLSPRFRAHVLGRLRPVLLEPELGNKRCHGHGKPALHNREQPPLAATGENLGTAAKTRLGHQSVIKTHSWFLCRRARPAWRRRWRLLAPWRAWAARTQGSGQCSAPDGSRMLCPRLGHRGPRSGSPLGMRTCWRPGARKWPRGEFPPCEMTPDVCQHWSADISDFLECLPSL